MHRTYYDCLPVLIDTVEGIPSSNWFFFSPPPLPLSPLIFFLLPLASTTIPHLLYILHLNHDVQDLPTSSLHLQLIVDQGHRLPASSQELMMTNTFGQSSL